VEDLQSVSGSISSLGSKAQKLVPAGIVRSLRGQNSGGSISEVPPKAVEETEKQKNESPQERESQEREPESSPMSSGSEPTVVENSA
jgi:hypothetical protein